MTTYTVTVTDDIDDVVLVQKVNITVKGDNLDGKRAIYTAGQEVWDSDLKAYYTPHK